MTKTKRKHCYRPLLKVMETVVLIKDVLRRQLQLVGDELSLGWSVPNPQLMGSMHYRLATLPSAENCLREFSSAQTVYFRRNKWNHKCAESGKATCGAI